MIAGTMLPSELQLPEPQDMGFGFGDIEEDALLWLDEFGQETAAKGRATSCLPAEPLCI